MAVHQDAVDNVEDARLSAVFYYTAPRCRASKFQLLINEFSFINQAICNKLLSSCAARKWVTPILDELCEQFQHIKMYMVYMDKNIAGSSLDKLGIYKTPMFHCYLKGERVDEVSGASIKHLKEEMTDDEDKMPFDEEKRAKDKMWWFAKGLFSSKKKREMFCKLKDPEAKREWIKSEMAKE
ncbi:hypothetical protein GBA52_016959 [Prunus armeniaca]|nr:hypothetical protein GBA52_016959 [Prunus armeniaca]